MSAEVVSDAGRTAGVGIVTAVTLELFGLPAQPIAFGLIGGFIGTGFAKPTTPLRGFGLYVSASLVSALVGHALATHYFPTFEHASSVLSATLGIFFHPILAAVAERVPAAFDAILATLGKRGAP